MNRFKKMIYNIIKLTMIFRCKMIIKYNLKKKITSQILYI